MFKLCSRALALRSFLLGVLLRPIWFLLELDYLCQVFINIKIARCVSDEVQGAIVELCLWNLVTTRIVVILFFSCDWHIGSNVPSLYLIVNMV